MEHPKPVEKRELRTTISRSQREADNKDHLKNTLKLGKPSRRKPIIPKNPRIYNNH